MYGDKSVDAPFDKGPNRGYATAALRYTLAGSGRKAFPEAVEDALAAIRFLRAKAGDYCFNPDKVVVAGFSAGGYYTAIVAALTGASNHSFDNASLGNAGFSSKVQAAVSSAALTDLLLLDQQQKDLGGSNWMMSTHCGRSEMSGQLFGFDPCTATGANADIVASSNPLNYITAANCAGIPPILMQHGTGDNLIPYLQSKIMVDKLNEVCGAGKAQFKQHTGGHQAYGSETDIFKFLDNALK
jgi:acetyl esterase/lipase